MNVLIAGGSGFLGSALTDVLIKKNYQVIWLSSTANQQRQNQNNSNISIFSYNDLQHVDFPQVDVLINLAGAGIADKPWSDKRKAVLSASRIAVTERLIHWLDTCQQKQQRLPHTFISGSAIGWYGAQSSDTKLTEHSSAVHCYQHQLCDNWEKAALKASELTRTLIVRTGVVLDHSGGMLAKVNTPFSLGLGGNLGHGKQVFSWIALDDWLQAVLFLLENTDQQGIYNLTAPNPVSNATFTKTLAQHLNRPAFLHVPSFVLKTLLGDMSTLLLEGQQVIPQKLLDNGFIFKYQHLIDLLPPYK